jgi:4-hydroxy-2-oxoheptanedioate aldolase
LIAYKDVTMNSIERNMVDLLKDLREQYHVSGVKAEFEAEGTRIEEAMRLKDVTSLAGLDLNIKIGGCEAIKDMYDAVNLGARRIISPMIETPYALEKFLNASQIVFKDTLDSIELLVNIETCSAFQNFSEMLEVSNIKLLNGVVLGRVDMCGSLGLERDQVNSKAILNMALAIAEKAKAKGLIVVVGGGVSFAALPFFKAFPTGYIDRFETRKIIFSCPGALNNSEGAFLKAVEFELLWLKNKSNYYKSISHEDSKRIDMMERRYQSAINEINKSVEQILL